jgi:hypothetical protein
MGGELDVLVPPFGCPVLACDQTRSVDAAEVSVDESIPGLGLVSSAISEPEVPFGVLRP